MTRFFHFLRLAAALAMLSISPLSVAESLHYQASYNGVLSMFQDLPIADVWYKTGQVAEVENLARVSLTVSSENFDLVERLYPFRYLLHTYVDPARWQTLLFEIVKVTKKERKTRHRVGLFDAARSRIQLYKSSYRQPVLEPALLAAFVADRDGRKLVKKLQLKRKGRPLKNISTWPVDQLTLLNLVRQQVQAVESERSYAVSSGDELLDYRVTLGKSELVMVGGAQMPAVKVKVEAYDALQEPSAPKGQGFLQAEANADSMSLNSEKPASDGTSKKGQAVNTRRDYAHAPVYIWISQDQQALPLRFENQHPIGRFIIELKALPAD